MRFRTLQANPTPRALIAVALLAAADVALEKDRRYAQGLLGTVTLHTDGARNRGLRIVTLPDGGVVVAGLSQDTATGVSSLVLATFDILMSLGRQGEALEASERARARALLDTLVAARAVAGDADDNGERDAALTRPQPLSLAEIQRRVLDEEVRR